jgi:hypothetical protein
MSYVAPVTAVLVIMWTTNAEQGRRQRRIDEAGGDEVDPDRRELQREGRDELRQSKRRTTPVSSKGDEPHRRRLQVLFA